MSSDNCFCRNCRARTCTVSLAAAVSTSIFSPDRFAKSFSKPLLSETKEAEKEEEEEDDDDDDAFDETATDSKIAIQKARNLDCLCMVVARNQLLLIILGEVENRAVIHEREKAQCPHKGMMMRFDNGQRRCALPLLQEQQ